MSLGEGFGVGFKGVVGGGFPVKNKGKGKGVGRMGGGEGTGEGTGKSMHKLCRNYPLANYPLVSPLLKPRTWCRPNPTTQALVRVSPHRNR